MINLARNSVTMALVAGSVVASPVALAELTANAAVTSNYVWRGQTVTDDGAALQGGLDYAHDSGLYVGAWASNVEWADEDDAGNEVNIGGVEYDLYAGFANEIGDFGYDVGYLTYNYTDEDADNANEIKLGVSYSVASFNYYIGDTGADSENEYTYYELGLDFDLPAEIALGLHYGVIEYDVTNAEQVDDYSVSFGKDFGGFNVALSYADHKEDDGLFFATVSKEFEL